MEEGREIVRVGIRNGKGWGRVTLPPLGDMIHDLALTLLGLRAKIKSSVPC